jgi:micrococcal nuclease
VVLRNCSFFENVFDQEQEYRDQEEWPSTSNRNNNSNSSARQTFQHAASADRNTVYITDTGKKYHYADCRSLRPSETIYPVTREYARQYYDPCAICNP